MHTCICMVISASVFGQFFFQHLRDCLLLTLVFDKPMCLFFCVCLKAGSDHHAGTVRRRPQVVDGGHGWERTGRLPRLPVGSDVKEKRRKKRKTERLRWRSCPVSKTGALIFKIIFVVVQQHHLSTANVKQRFSIRSSLSA